MNKVFTKNGWDDYIYWQTEDRKALKRTISRRSLRILESQNQGEGSIDL